MSAAALGVLAITRHGIHVAARVIATAADPAARLYVPEKFAEHAETLAPGQVCAYAGKTADQVAGLFAAHRLLVAVVSLGAVVRLIAPHLGDKQHDPGVVVVDEAARFVIPVLSGHLGGANALAGQLAARLGATAVLTTASDARQTLAVDLLGREFGWQLQPSGDARADHDTLVRVAAAMVNDEVVALVHEAARPGQTDWWRGHANGRSGPRPAHLLVLSAAELAQCPATALLWISPRPLPAELAARFAGRVLIYRQPADASDAT